MHSENSHRVVVRIGLDRVVLPDVALGLLTSPCDELLDG